MSRCVCERYCNVTDLTMNNVLKKTVHGCLCLVYLMCIFVGGYEFDVSIIVMESKDQERQIRNQKLNSDVIFET